MPNLDPQSEQPDGQPAPMSLSEFTYVVLSTEPTPEGGKWTYVQASSVGEALELGAEQLAAPHIAFKLPTQRTKALANHLARYAHVWMAGIFTTIVFMTFQLRRSGQGFVVLSWAGAFGYAVLLVFALLLLGLTYLTVLDLACAHVGARILSERSRGAGGDSSRAASVDDIMEAYGTERVGSTVRTVTLYFGAALLILTVIGVLTR
jgi:hypothetical protein